MFLKYKHPNRNITMSVGVYFLEVMFIRRCLLFRGLELLVLEQFMDMILLNWQVKVTSTIGMPLQIVKNYVPLVGMYRTQQNGEL